MMDIRYHVFSVDLYAQACSALLSSLLTPSGDAKPVKMFPARTSWNHSLTGTIYTFNFARTSYSCGTILKITYQWLSNHTTEASADLGFRDRYSGLCRRTIVGLIACEPRHNRSISDQSSINKLKLICGTCNAAGSPLRPPPGPTDIRSRRNEVPFR